MAKLTIQRGYSTDIHLFLTGALDPVTQDATVGKSAKVLIAVGGSVAAATYIPLLTQQFTLLKPPGQAAATPNPIAFSVEVVPQEPQQLQLVFSVKDTAAGTPTGTTAIGETFCRVALTDADNREQYLLFRVTVHTKLNRFWVGNRRLTVYNNTDADSNQLAVYGECLDGTLISQVDLSGCSYITHDVNYPPAGPVQSGLLLQGSSLMAKVTGQPSPTVPVATIDTCIGDLNPTVLPGLATQVPVYVLPSLSTTPQRVLRTFYRGGIADSGRKTRILFVPEGFRNQAEVQPWLDFVQNELLHNNLHTPFDLVSDALELWTADLFSHDTQAGVTLKSPLNDQGYFVPAYPVANVPGGARQQLDDRPGKYTLYQLLRYVGLPLPGTATDLSGAKRQWASANVPPIRVDGVNQPFDPGKVDKLLFNFWRQQVPKHFGIARDTVWGLAKGTIFRRQSDAYTPLEPRDFLLDSPPNWPMRDDDRAGISTVEERCNALLRSLQTSPTAKNDAQITGGIWVAGSNDRSAGLVCFIVNDPTVGGVSFKSGEAFLSSTFSTGDLFAYELPPAAAPVLDVPVPVLTPTQTPRAAITSTKAVGVLIHEIGHLLGMGDEYGNKYGKTAGKASLLNGDDTVSQYINLYTAYDLLANGLTDAANLAEKPPGGPLDGKLLHPELIKWNWDRIDLSSIVLAPLEVPAPAAGATPTYLVRVEDNLEWIARTKPTVKPTVVLRPAQLDRTEPPPLPSPAPPGALTPLSKQLVPLTELTLLKAERKKVTGSDSDYYVELTLEGTTMPLDDKTKKPLLGKYDVLYIPRYYSGAAGTGRMRLIPDEVAKVLQAKRFVATAPIAACGVASAARQNPTQEIVSAMNTELKNRKRTTGHTKVENPPTSAPPANSSVVYSTAPPPAPAANISFNSSSIIALYEGGGEYDCQTYRPTGFSKMRSAYLYDGGDSAQAAEIVPFSYVQQYYLVNKLNPTKLAELDGTYETKAY